MKMNDLARAQGPWAPGPGPQAQAPGLAWVGRPGGPGQLSKADRLSQWRRYLFTVDSIFPGLVWLLALGRDLFIKN